jgi:hypothetical protein
VVDAAQRDAAGAYPVLGFTTRKVADHGGGEHGWGVRFRHVRKPGGLVHGRSDDRVFEAALGADVSRDELAGGESDPRRDSGAGQGLGQDSRRA